jgi:peptide/nickel transport system ATP-binding protein
MTGDELVSVDDLWVSFGTTPAVRGVSFSLTPGTCLAVVGESGSGKSVTARALVGLAGPGATVRAARLEVTGADVLTVPETRLREIRGRRIGLMSQDALTSLDPIRPVGAEIAEALRAHRTVGPDRVGPRVLELLAQVRIPEPGIRARQYPYQLSGGLRQRALIASAMAAEPPVLVADEPTTALDVAVQAQILDLLAARKAAGTALLLISHDLSVVARLADRIAVMYRGQFVETGSTADLLNNPRHPYTRQLLAAVPATHAKGTRLSVSAAASGTPPDPSQACGFAHHCPIAIDGCRAKAPAPAPVGADHLARCSRTDVPWPTPPRTTRTGRTGPGETVLRAEHLVASFTDPGGGRRVAVDDVSFTVAQGETVGVLGESGSGKTTTALLVLGLLAPERGEVELLGEPWSSVAESRRRHHRRRIQLIPQDPYGSFDPRYPVERLIAEPLGAWTRRAVRRCRPQVLDLLRRVGLDPDVARRRPRELSGGQRQRVAIARALAPEPALIVCDEPVSALDVSVQAQILDLLGDIQEQSGIAMVFISHDLGVIQHMSDRVLVMKDGAVVETGLVEDIFHRPAHPYTQSLLAALPLPTATGPG